ncbi:aminotransferase class I/II-fold pyridoxal phosphate-dependent enzyme [Neisseria meningitidis]|uniref:aminotransferase class I/II-fold pyridoxal phosphate-dependent enzyme n=1 Tax=Neisseria meningitidis TaxID=487 RepID=UPI000E573BB1|nr:aminotransferase class I/II-fold pyridoxal phosphate-dependent enzyme [Neisseria meningitidis]
MPPRASARPSPPRYWKHENIILCFSLSKVGLPGVRTGIIVAAPEVVKAVSSLNAIVNLAPTRFGAAIAAPLLET